VGDTWKDTPMLHHILQDAAAQGDVLQVNLGDLTPQGRPEQLADFARVIGGAALPVFPVPGNHDVAWSKTTAPFEQYWPRHQSFDRQNAHFTLVDDSAVTLDQAELDWIDADLSATQQPVKFVFMHVPALMPYPVPAESALQAGGPEFMALMEKHHVTAVYAGHLHAYTRVEHNGIPYIITGGGGEPLHVPSLLGGRYHYVRVAVRGTTAGDTVVLLNNVPTPGP
jgi:3',5'-cyclic AMP phosphodiesterase CpdA